MPKHSRLRKNRVVAERLEKLATDQPVLLSFLVFLAVAVMVVAASIPFFRRNPEDLMTNIVAEAYGMAMDLLVIGWFITWMNRRAERRIMIRGYQEEIENFLRWESVEAMHRIAGNIRRLNQEGLTELDLEHAYLRGAYLVEVNLAGARLRGATLSSAKLERAVLQRTDMLGADLGLANCVETDLYQANMVDANCMGAYMLRANLEGTYLKCTNLQGAYLVEANMRSAYLGDANLQGAILERADLRGAYLEGSNLERAKSLFDARLDPDVEARLRHDHPQLFEQAKLPAPTGPTGHLATYRPDLNPIATSDSP